MIRTVQVDKHFRSRGRTLHVADHIDLAVPEGGFMALLGASGSGKTTMLRIIAGLEHHDSGEVWFGDQLMSCPERGLFVPPARRPIGMVFQSYAIWPHMNVFGNVAYPLKQRASSLAPAEVRRRVAEVLELVGLGHLGAASAMALSGGQQQRVALARALVARPKVLLLDEPLSNLDVQLRERMRVEIRDIQRSLGITTVYVTHDRAEALSMATVIAVMNRGRIEMTGQPEAIYERPATASTAEFLGACNVIKGTMGTPGATGATMAETAFGAIACRTPQDYPPGQLVDVLVRPEDIDLSAADGERNGPWIGTVSRATYVGDRLECMVSLQGGELRAVAHPATALRSGCTVRVAIRPQRLWALASPT